MKKLILIFALLISTLISPAQVPANDNCATAQNLGTLPTPAACPSGIGAAVTVGGTNINATYPAIYTTLLGCQTGGNQPGPAFDVWYSFVASGNIATINITPGGAPTLASPAITLWRGTCAGLIGVGCDNNGTVGGNNTAVFQPLTPGQTYYVQVSGMNNVTQGNFNISVAASNDCNNCLQIGNLTVSPAPVNGTYPPNTAVTFCYNITSYTQVSANWLHGLTYTFGCGWNPASIVATPPPSCSGNGTWAWYNTWTSSANASVWGPGFAYNYTFPADANPGNNFGDLCATPNWNFCMTITTDAACVPGCTSLNMSINTSGDGESGSWGSIACLGDPNVTFAGVLSCCTTTAAGTNPTCFNGTNGTATATPSGSAPFTYTWNSTPIQNTQVATGLPAGTYTVSVTDNNGCVSTAVVTLTNPTQITVPIVKTNVTCFGGNNGTATANPVGGTGPYTYLWSNGQTTQTATGLIAGTYTVTVTGVGPCTATQTVNITQPTQVTVTTTTVNATCSLLNGSATANPIGGVGPYTYSWNTTPVQTTQTAAGIGAGTYTVIVTSVGGCTATATAIVSSTGSITATATGTNVSCFGGTNGSATATPLGGGPYTYTWNSTPVQNTQVATNLPAGNYTVTVNSFGCIATATITITQPTLLNASSTQTNVTCFGGNNGSASVTPIGGTGPYTYSWNTTPIQTAATATALTAGSYTCTITDFKGCTRTISVTITQPTQVVIATNQVNTTCGLPNGSATANPAGGVGPYTYLWSNGQTTQTAINLLAGPYTVTVTSVGGCTTTAAVNILNTGAPTVSIPTQTNVSCFNGNNGIANSSVIGGVGPFTYTWNSTPIQNTSNANNLPAGSYTLTVTGSNGCTATATVTITQPTQLTATNAQTNVSCFGGNNGSAIANPLGGTAPYIYSWSNGQVTQTAINLIAGSYTCTIIDFKGCTVTTSVTITQPTQLTATNNQTNIVCFGGTGTASVTPSGGTGPYTYSWNSTPIQTTQTATALIVGSYTCTITDFKGCTITQVVNITQPTQVTSVITMTPSNCGLPNGSATVTPSGGVGPYTYLWSNGQTTQTAINLLAGPYTVTVTSVGGCTTTNNIVVTNNGSPTANITAQTNVLCFGNNTGLLTVTPVGGIPPYTYLWSNGQTTQTAINLLAGPYTVTVTASNGCTALASGTITQPTQLNASITTINVLCFGNNTGSATATPSGGTGPYTYLWSNAQTTQTATNLLAATYNCTVTDNNGCTIVVAANITQPTQVSLVITSTSNPLCNGSANGSITVSAAGGVGPNYLYSLNAGPNQLSPIFSGLVAGTHTIIVTDQNGCTSTVTVTLTEPVILTMNANIMDVTCFNACDGFILSNPVGGTGPYTYLYSNGSTSNPMNGVCAGTYSVIITDANGCQTGMTGLTVSQPNLLVVNPTALQPSICIGQTSLLNSNPVGGTGPYTFTWSTGANTQNTSVSPITTTTYTINITDANGCTASSIVTVIVHPPLTGSASSAPSSICAGQSSTISATANGGTSGPYIYNWTPGGLGQNLTVTPNITTTYTVNISDGCSASVNYTTTVTVNPIPVVTYTTTGLSGCEPLTVTYTNTTPLSGSCIWTINGIPTNNCTVTQTFNTQGIYPAVLTVTSINGCVGSSGTINATVHPMPIAQFSTSPNIANIFEPIITFNNLSSVGTYQWTFGDGNTSTQSFPTHTYGNVGTYTIQLVVTTQYGCTDTTYGVVIIHDIFSVYVPNTFTPNGDGLNEVWYPVVTGAEYYQFWVFDRWGEEIYDSSNLGAPWPGTYKGKDVQQDVYVWKLQIKEKNSAKVHNLVGHVTVVR